MPCAFNTKLPAPQATALLIVSVPSASTVTVLAELSVLIVVYVTPEPVAAGREPVRAATEALTP